MIVESELVQATCPNCGTVFCIQSQIRDARQRDKGPFYCPNGHAMNFISESPSEKVAKLEAQIKELEKELEDHKTHNRQLKCKVLEYENKLKKGLTP